MVNLHKLFQMQAQLDNRIEKEHQLQHVPLLDKKILSLLVELGELANETRCFKFWSTKPPAKQEVILEEYVDGVHFILSIGLDLGVEEEIQIESIDQQREVVDQFHVMYKAITEFHKHTDIAHYKVLFKEYFYLGKLLGFSHEEIEDAYMKKNEVNHKRQDQGY